MSTPLDAYMDEHDVKDAEFAVLIGRDRTIVSKLRRGVIRPTLDTAAMIEAKTNGAIKMQDWALTVPAPEPAGGPRPSHAKAA